jgi:hypothetical protein
MNLSTHTEAIRAMWLFNCVKYTAEEIGKPTIDTAELLDEYGLVSWALDGYEVLHTQGYEYMAEVLSDTLRERQGA